MMTREQLIEKIEAEVQCTGKFTRVHQLSAEIIASLKQVPRQEFVGESEKPFAFENRPLPIGQGQTISQPYMVAIMTALLELHPDFRVLEIGTGCGYQAAVLSNLVKEVYSVERLPSLYESARKRLQQLGYHNIRVKHGDGYAGWPGHAPYDAVIVTAAARILPVALVEQLRPGGYLVIPIGEQFDQHLKRVHKSKSGEIHVESLLHVAFVPMTKGCME